MIDHETGLKYCIDELFYHEALSDFIADSDSRLKKLSTSFENEDWEEYKKTVHALKSLSNVIGATRLSEASQEHQFAAMNRDIDCITKNYDSLIAEYREVLCEAQNIISN